MISLVFSYLSKVLFSGFLEFRGNFVDGRNNSNYRDVAPLRHYRVATAREKSGKIRFHARSGSFVSGQGISTSVKSRGILY